MEEMTKQEKIERIQRIADEAADKLMYYFESQDESQESDDDTMKDLYLAALDLAWAVAFMRGILDETTNETKEMEEA